MGDRQEPLQLRFLPWPLEPMLHNDREGGQLLPTSFESWPSEPDGRRSVAVPLDPAPDP